MKKLLILIPIAIAVLYAAPSQSVQKPKLPAKETSQNDISTPPGILLDDNERETDLRASLEANRSLRDHVIIQSVNCEKGRCEVLLEKISENFQVVEAINAHIKQNPKFGNKASVASNGDKENKKLLTLVISTADSASSAH